MGFSVFSAYIAAGDCKRVDGKRLQRACLREEPH